VSNGVAPIGNLVVVPWTCLRTGPRLAEFREPKICKPVNWEGWRGLANGMTMTLGPEPASAQDNPVTAIDIAFEPDQTMVGHAKAANAALLKNFPKGFALDATHHPHISMFAGFVPTVDLPKVYNVAGKILGSVANFCPRRRGGMISGNEFGGTASGDRVQR
jgi:hypothetical protein